MKLLAFAVLLQTAAIIFLTVEVIDVNRTLAEAAAEDVAPAVVEKKWEAPAPSSIPFDESRLIAVIREEIGSALASSQSSAMPSSTDDSFQPSPIEVQNLEMKLENVIAAGHVSQKELELLHMDIGRLGREYGKEMLGQLARAVNSGRVRITIN